MSSLLKLFIWVVTLAFFVAKVEIQIEGKDGWAKNLPTWRYKNWLTRIFLGDLEITGYHLWMFSLILFLLHFPFVLDNYWNLNIELKILAIFLFFIIIEDFLWFVLNPAFGLRKFKPKYIPWHKDWTGGLIPTSYLKSITVGIALLILSLLF
ncbi:hypothetical protein HYS93_03775 [Candidatus Daviesbacteria bacterium]|nr:hypothetical protein [Candidatus Daviesbacteria bacterium]